MVAINAPFGMRPIRSPSGIIRPRAFAGGIVSGYATDILGGQPVRIDPTTRKIVPILANNVDIQGVFAGVEFSDSSGRRRTQPNWPASQVATDIVAYVDGFEISDMVYEIQADGPVAATKLMDEAPVVDFAAGSTVTGYSGCRISSTFVGTTVQSQLRVVDKGLGPDNDWGDAFTVVAVMIARPQLAAAKAAV